ncbi:amino acid ABC transporter permease [Aeromonas media]|uniref:amino acid ABC transporter permease n=1 Tax=Aeromonas media TaxID=651 RepID=UPI00263F7AEE|nr:amino acid ABC transporter permease [Aeromonas media]
MEKQPNLLLWHGVFLLMLLAAIFGIYKAVQAVDYTWRWERIPQYIAYQAEQKQYAEFDGTVVAGTTAAEKGQLFLQDDLDPNRRQAIASTGAQVAEGDTVFLGDTLDVQLSWTAGPIAWGVWVTVKLSLVAGVFAILLGTLAGLARLSPNPALRNLAVTYVELIRGTPLLVQIFIVYFFIGTVLNLDRFTAGVAALAVFTGAYVAEIVRAGISSIHKGQMEAGRSLGLTSAQTMRYVILPQAFKRVLPPWRASSSTSSRTPPWSRSSPSRISPRPGGRWSAPPSARSRCGSPWPCSTWCSPAPSPSWYAVWR